MALAAMARALRSLATDAPRAFQKAIGDALPWLAVLPAADRKAFGQEFSQLIAAATELEAYGRLAQLILEWRATAEVHADAPLARRLRRPVSAKRRSVVRPGG